MFSTTATTTDTHSAAEVPFKFLVPKLQLLAAVVFRGPSDAYTISEDSNQPLDHRLLLIDHKYAVRLPRRAVPSEDLLEYAATLVLVNSITSLAAPTLIRFDATANNALMSPYVIETVPEGDSVAYRCFPYVLKTAPEGDSLAYVKGMLNANHRISIAQQLGQMYKDISMRPFIVMGNVKDLYLLETPFSPQLLNKNQPQPAILPAYLAKTDKSVYEPVISAFLNKRGIKAPDLNPLNALASLLKGTQAWIGSYPLGQTFFPTAYGRVEELLKVIDNSSDLLKGTSTYLTHPDLNNSHVFVKIIDEKNVKVTGVTGWEGCKFLYASEAFAYPQATSYPEETEALTRAFRSSAGETVAKVLENPLSEATKWLADIARLGMYMEDVPRIVNLQRQFGETRTLTMPDLEAVGGLIGEAGSVNETFSRYQVCIDWLAETPDPDPDVFLFT